MKQLLVLFMALALAMPTKAQWDRWNTSYAISGVLSIASQSIASAERKKAMEIHAKQKAEFQQSFQEAMDEAKAFEAVENWEEALEKYEEAAKLNVKYGYTDQHSLSRKITSLYVKGEREDDGPSILNNDKTILPDYSGYRYVRENPVYVNKKKEAMAGIVRVACSDKETRLELELEATHPNYTACIKGTAYIKGDARVPEIAAASIVAKTYRDALRRHFAELWPEYGFERHVGYGTAFHRKVLASAGPCPLHRHSFRGVDRKS